MSAALRSPSQSSRHYAVLRLPSPLQSQFIGVAHAPSLAVHCHQGAVAPSITVKFLSHRPSTTLRSQSIAIAIRIAPSLTIHRCRGATAPSIAIEEPLRRPLTSRPTVHHCRVAVHRHQSVHCFQVYFALSIAIHCRQVAVVLSIAIHRPSQLSLCCAVHYCPHHRAVAVHRPSPASVHCHRAVNHHLLSVWLLRCLLSHRRLLSTNSGISVRHVQPFSDARHNSLTWWEAACVVLRWI